MRESYARCMRLESSGAYPTWIYTNNQSGRGMEELYAVSSHNVMNKTLNSHGPRTR